MGDFKKLIVWQRSRKLAVEIYRVTDGFPVAEAYGLTSQNRRAVASIPANIAEGAGRGGDRDQARFYRVALASARELESHLLLSADLGMLSHSNQSNLMLQLDEVQRMLMGLIRRVASMSRQRVVRSPVSSLESADSRLPSPDSRLHK